MENGRQHKHVVMLPFMAQGHMIPFLALARQIEQRTGYAITIATTPINAVYLRSSISSSTTTTTTTIRVVELPFCSADHGLPPNTENTEALPNHHIMTLFRASQTLEPSFHNLVSTITEKYGEPPLCIIADVFFGWSVDVAMRFGSFHVGFTTCGGYGTAAYISLWLNLPHRHTDSDDFTVPGFPETCRFLRSQLNPTLRSADGTDPWSTVFRRELQLSLRSNGFLCNTVEEMETFGLEALRAVTGIPVWPIGPLQPPAFLNLPCTTDSNLSSSRSVKKHGIAPENCIKWLDYHPPGSVLYISFGSQNTINPTQMMELAMGVEASGKAFIWVVRPPVGFDINGEFKAEWLPEGFEERVTESRRGLVVRTWAPQLEILSHKSTGAFLSHCGWNSSLESLSQGVPIIGWPLVAEQAYNSKMMEEEMGVCVELARGPDSRVLSEEVERVIELVMGEGEKGKEMKMKASEAAKKIRAAVREGDQLGSSVKALDDFLQTALSKRHENADEAMTRRAIAAGQ
ncbi:PREDICTED: UDP-glycosyltransferase 92A1-like [Nelumbo nucifera]|uniref:Glycosyltransferase n=2 Tax=Nelumbo nucifera TaxID=4432 RepID=A0A822XYY0_NELNU|nr:PREDICTED: UDP-glycosyltransferase 92A1-like [Nelumbo nucifera]DAD24196.1 TPA_asm: hypothetical protein HUJ06_025659 [Nelumbo nucifera]